MPHKLHTLGFHKVAVVGSATIRAALNQAKKYKVPIFRDPATLVKSVSSNEVNSSRIGKIFNRLLEIPFNKTMGSYHPELPNKPIMVGRKAIKKGTRDTPGNTLLHELGHAKDDIIDKSDLNIGSSAMGQIKGELTANRNAVSFIKKHEKPELLQASLRSYRSEGRKAMNTYRTQAIRTEHRMNKVREKGLIKGLWAARGKKVPFSDVKTIMRDNPILREKF